MQGYANPQIEDYLSRLRGSMFLLDGKAKKGILEETRGHLYASAYQDGTGSDAVSRALYEYGDPKELAKEYKQLYGYTTWFTVGMSALSLLLAIFSIPLVVFNSGGVTLAFLLVAIITMTASVIAGKKSGLAVGGTAAVTRILGTLIIAGLASSNPEVMVDGGAVASMLFSSLLLFVIGYAPGRTLEHFEKRREEDFEMF